MTEDTFRQVRLDTLLHLLVQSTKEYNDVVANKENEIRIQIRKEEVDLLQKAIIAKRAENNPG